MRPFGWDEVRIGNEQLTSTSGLALVGRLIQRSGLPEAFDRLEPVGRPERTSGGTIGCNAPMTPSASSTRPGLSAGS